MMKKFSAPVLFLLLGLSPAAAETAWRIDFPFRHLRKPLASHTSTSELVQMPEKGRHGVKLTAEERGRGPGGDPPAFAASGKPGVRSGESLVAHCLPRSVSIEIAGHDSEGGWVSHGAGSILHESGYILTCEHITAAGDRNHVILSDGASFPYRVVWRAGGTYDMAVLKIEGREPLPEVALGHSDAVSAGERVMIVGNPGGRRHSRLFGEVEQTSCGGGTQIHVGKARVMPGYSGGPVFNMRGELVAQVHVSIRTMEMASRHIRVDHLRTAFADMIRTAGTQGFEVGLTVDCQADEAAVAAVAPGSPAARAGIRPRDVLTRVGAMRLRHGPHYAVALCEIQSADPVGFAFRRGDKEMSATVIPVSRKPPPHRP